MGRRAALCLAWAITTLGSAADAAVLADSFSDWNPGLQNANHWAYGWRNLATHPGDYDPSHFQLFLNDASGGSTPVSQNGPNQWDGVAWDFGLGAPWTNLGQLACHPNGVNNGEEHWVIRRWSHPSDENLRITWQITDTNVNGSGVTGRLFLDGTELASFKTDGPSESLVYYVAYLADQTIDFAITPLGVDGDPSDMGDGVETTVVIDTDIPPNAMNPIGVVADSVADFSEFQGQDGWSYGYYDQRADVEQGNLTYDVSDLILFLNNGSAAIASDPTIGAWKSHPNHWDGSMWDLFDQGAYFQGPWTFMSEERAQPAANGQVDSSVLWAVRRWVSDFEGIATVSGTLDNAGGGDGVRAHFLADGFEYTSKLSDGTPAPFSVDVPVAIGTVLDFALDADGSFALNLFDPTTLDDVSDTSDQSDFDLLIEGRVSFVPEPASGVSRGLGVAMLLWLAWSRASRNGAGAGRRCRAVAVTLRRFLLPTAEAHWTDLDPAALPGMHADGE